MTSGTTRALNDLVELLVAGGAAAPPGAATLLQSLAAPRRRGPRELLGRALAIDGAVADAGLRRELTAVAGASAPDDRIAAALERLGPALRATLAERWRALNGELGPWLAALEPAERADLLAGLWRTERCATVEEQIGALEELEAVRGRLAEARARLEQRARTLIASIGESDPSTEGARRALAASDPRALAEALQGLESLDREATRRRAGEELDRLRASLGSLCDRAAELAGERPGQGAAAGLLAALAGTAREHLASIESGGPDADGAVVEALGGWEATLRAAVDAEAQAADRRGRREELAAAVLARLAAGRRRAGVDDAADAEAERALREAAAAGGTGFHEGMERGLERARELRAGAVSRGEAATAALHDAAGNLTGILERAAPSLPTERVVAARLALEGAAETAASAEAARIDPLAETLRRLGAELEAEAAERSEQERDRGEAARRRLLDQARGLVELARGRASRGLRELVGRIERAEAAELAGLAQRLDDMARPIRNAVRLQAVEARPRAGGEASEALGEALERDDLPALARLAAGVGSESTLRRRLRGPLGWLALTLVFVLLLGGVLAGRSWLAGRAKDYVLALDAEPAGPVEVTLVGERTLKQPYEPTRGASFRLPPGRYAIYVNDHFTGRTIRAPDDPSEVKGIPLPPAAGAE